MVLKDVQVPYEAEVPLEIKPVAVFQFASDDVNNFIFENEDIKVYYNFYGKESTIGTMYFTIQNKTSQNIFLGLTPQTPISLKISLILKAVSHYIKI